MVPLLGALLDYDSDPETYARYDAMSARELFRQYGERNCCSKGARMRLPHEVRVASGIGCKVQAVPSIAAAAAALGALAFSHTTAHFQSSVRM